MVIVYLISGRCQYPVIQLQFLQLQIAAVQYERRIARRSPRVAAHAQPRDDHGVILVQLEDKLGFVDQVIGDAVVAQKYGLALGFVHELSFSIKNQTGPGYLGSTD